MRSWRCPGGNRALMLAGTLAVVLAGVPIAAAGAPSALAASGVAASTTPWWAWPLGLFAVCLVLGIVAIPAGVGGGVLFVPIVSSFFPFHLDFVRGAGLLVALASALAAGPSLLKSGLADLRLALPLALPPNVVQTALGVTILALVALMSLAKKSERPEVARPDALSAALRIHGVFRDAASGRVVAWQVHRTPLGLAIFVAIGAIGGIFGVGAGWANVPALNLLMGAPIKVAAASSSLILSLASSSAAWIYINHGAVLAAIVVPSMVGMMLGARIGAHLLGVMKASTVRRLVLLLLLFSGLRALLKGLGLWN